MNQIRLIYRFCFFLLFSIILLIVDHKSRVLNPLHKVTSLINIQFEYLVGLPRFIQIALKKYYPDDEFYKRYTELKNKQMILKLQLQRYDSLLNENQKLLKLLGASQKSGDEVILSKVISIHLEKYTQKVVVNQGIESGVYVGQSAMAPDGVVGQVSKVGYHRSLITLITDTSHSLPVQIQRNGLQTIVQGHGHKRMVTLPFLGQDSDVIEGDILVTSGLGGRFPVGYKVATVHKIVKDTNKAFLNVIGTTFAQVDSLQEILLIWNDDRPADVDRSNFARFITEK